MARAVEKIVDKKSCFGRLFPIVYTLMFLYGVQATVLGVILPDLIRDYATTAGAGGFLVTAQTTGGLGVLVLIVLYGKKISRTSFMVVAFMIMGVTSAIVAIAPPYVIVSTIFVVLGAGMRLFDTASNSFIGEYAVARRNRSMNLLHTCFAGGAIAGPIVAQVLLNVTESWPTIYLTMGISSILIALPILLLRGKPNTDSARNGGKEDEASSTSQIRFLQLFRDPKVTFIALTLALYAVHQSSLTAWIPHLLESTGNFSGESGGGISIYWVGIFAGRIVATKLPDSTDRMLVVAFGTTIGAVATTAAVMFVHHPAIVLLFLFIAGASSGALIPLSLSAGQVRYPDRTTAVTALFSVFLLLGRFVGPWGIGLISDTSGIQSSMYITAGVLILSALTALLARNIRFVET